MPFFVTWLLNVVYVALLFAVSPLIVYRRMTQGKYRGGWREKLFGRLVRKHPERQCIWFHAVSVGEVLQLQNLLEMTTARCPDAELLITTTTDTGFEVARTKYPQHTVSYFPLDLSWAVRRAVASIRPSLVVLVELELWPNFVFAVRQQSIPLALINGRIGEKSFRGYSRIKPLVRHVLSCFNVMAVQNEVYAERLRALGASADKVVVTGNIKFDRVESERGNPQTNELRCVFGLAEGEQVFIAGSTQSPEESIALDTWMALREEFPQLRLVLVPRHKERFDEVASLVLKKGLPLRRRSSAGSEATAASEVAVDNSVPPVLLLDTLGELGACWGLADIAFVGGSLTNRGGQNMLEPGGYGAAVLFGPNTWNFRDVAESLLAQEAARVVTDSESLTHAVRDLLAHPEKANRMGQAARCFVASQRGATSRTIDLLMSNLTGQTGLAGSMRAA